MLCISSKRGMRDIESIKYSLKLLKDGEILVIFPEGTRKGLEKMERHKMEWHIWL